MSESKKRNGWLVPVLLIAAIAATFVLSFVLAPKHGAAEGEAFGGTDSIVTEHLEEKGVEPWFHPLIDLGSGELESGLFALQAAIGAGLAGYAVGNLRGRSAHRRETGELTEADDVLLTDHTATART